MYVFYTYTADTIKRIIAERETCVTWPAPNPFDLEQSNTAIKTLVFSAITTSSRSSLSVYQKSEPYFYSFVIRHIKLS